MKKRPVCLILRDGWGRGKDEPSNAIYMAKTPFTDAYEKTQPTTLVQTSGLSVGLPKGYQGNSEVGHLNIGAGRTIYQSLTKIDKSVEDGDFFTNEAFRGGNSPKSPFLGFIDGFPKLLKSGII